YWRAATVQGALAGMALGFLTWAWTMFLPSFATSNATVALLLANGPWGITALRPQVLFGMAGPDPLVHSVFWSMVFNTGTLILVSLATQQTTLGRVQAGVFVDVFRNDPDEEARAIRRSATGDDLFFLAERVLGWRRAKALFDAAEITRGTKASTATVSSEFVTRLERELASSIGAASAHILLSKVVQGDTISLEEVMQITDETQQVISYSHELEKKSRELRQTAWQ